MNPYHIKKSTGNTEDFSENKLSKSLIFAGASEEQAKEIITTIKSKISEQSTSHKIYKEAFRELKKQNRFLASHYSLARSINELGPDGFIFEKFVCAIFQSLGHRANTNFMAQGKCVKHEIDVVARSEKKDIFCECKFHNKTGYKNDLKTALYVQARALDVMANPVNKCDEFWLVSNTKFSEDAITYASCSGLKLLGPNFPKNHALVDLAKKAKIYPVTCLTHLKKSAIKNLFTHKIFFVHELIEQVELLTQKLNFSEDESKVIYHESKQLLGLK